ncbi:hypothetical protein C0J52_10133 [Blattella germanica]|nr:hypothetical protein C0J52_10133 [Blattella germanica]
MVSVLSKISTLCHSFYCILLGQSDIFDIHNGLKQGDALSPLLFNLNKILREIFGPKRDVETGEWRKLHNTELNDLSRMGDEMGKPEGKHPVVDYTGDDWKTLAQDRDVWGAYVRTAMNLRETCPDRESNPGPLRERRIRYPLLHNEDKTLR